jgi:hypothetical protein
MQFAGVMGLDTTIISPERRPKFYTDSRFSQQVFQWQSFAR